MDLNYRIQTVKKPVMGNRSPEIFFGGNLSTFRYTLALHAKRSGLTDLFVFSDAIVPQFFGYPVLKSLSNFTPLSLQYYSIIRHKTNTNNAYSLP